MFRRLRELFVLPILILAANAGASVLAQSLPTVAAREFLAKHPTLSIPAQANRISASASLNPRERFSGHVAPYAKRDTRVGAPSADAPLRLTALLSRAPEVQTAFEQLLADQQNPSSPMYHQWLTPAQVGELYGPTQSDIDVVTQWLETAGFQIEAVDPSRTRIRFTTTFGSAASAFQTSFADFAVRDRKIFSVTQEPSLPSALNGVLTGIAGLSQIPVYSHSHQINLPESAMVQSAYKPAYTGPSTGNHYLAPGDFNLIYDVNPVLNSGYTGTGQRVAIMGQSQVTTSDITKYQAAFGLPNTTVNVVIPSNGVDPGIAADAGEQTLDVERVIGTSPGATVDLVVSGDTKNDSGLDIAINWNVNTLVDKIMSISYGTCEPDYTAANSAANDSFFSQAAAEGITTFASSGDSGAQGCLGIDKTYQSGAYISGLCASSYVTCVGGTEFVEGSSPSTYWGSNGTNYVSALSYIPEGAWNEPTTTSSQGVTTYQQVGTGGGVSLYVAKPSWQTGTGVPADGKRDVPDISFTSSASHDGFLICYSDKTSTCGSTGFNTAFGGTSAAAPSMAGIMALVSQRTANGVGYGNINPLLYKLAASSPSAFHDVTVATSGVASCSVTTASVCNNSTAGSSGLTGGTAGYMVATGYDQATGLGSLDVNNFVSAVLTSQGNIFTIRPASTSLSVTAGGSITDALTLTSLNSFSGAVSLTCAVSTVTGTAAGTCSVSPASATLSAGGTASSTLTVNINANTTGTAKVVVTGSSGTTIATSPVITVNLTAAPASFTMAATPTSLSLTAGATSGNTTVVTTTSTNSFAGAVTLSCAAALTNGTTALVAPTCTMSPSSITLTANGTQTSTATITTQSTTSGCSTSSSSVVVPSVGPWKLGGSAVAFAALLIPIRRRKAIRNLLAVGLLACSLTWLGGCGSGGGVTTPCAVVTKTGTTTGTYTVMVTGTYGSSAAKTTFALTVN